MNEPWQSDKPRPPLVGQTLAGYRIDEQIGAGGMGVVYRALDTKLGRAVAVKVLPEACAKDPERRARLEREARLLAAVSHPHIAAIHGLESGGDACFLVLELVPGETLDERLASDPPDIRQALEIARQIADALEAAHERGIIHRDLKPSNVKIAPNGAVKVLDFGLAKALESQGASPADSVATVTHDATHAGVVLGTAAYMSPEQARGKATDKRTDIWAFGCVLYELLARRRAFRGETVSDSIAAVLTTEPDWAAVPDAVPPSVVRLMRRCLAKDPQMRLRDIGDARIELAEAVAAPETGARPRAARRITAASIGVAGVLVGAAAAAALVLFTRPGALPASVTRFSINMVPDEVLAASGTSVKLSADGRRVAWVANNVVGRTQIYSRQLDEPEAKALDGTAGAGSPFFSPDGRWLAFLHGGSRTLKKVALSGGAPVTVAPYETASVGAWPVDDEILMNMSYPGTIMRIPATGGKPTPVTELDIRTDERLHIRPELLRGGKAVLFTIGGGGMDTYDDGRIAVQSLETGERKIIIEGGMAATYSPTGHIVYAREGKLLAVPFNVERLQVTGTATPVLDGVFMCVNSGMAHYSLSDNGTLAYAPGLVLGGRRELVWVDRKGGVEPLQTPARAYLHPRLSPDEKRLAVEIEGPVHDFWTYDFGRGALTKFTTEGSSHWPLWTPDGKRLTFRRWLDGAFSMWWRPADLSGGPERLTDVGRMQSASSWSPDGRVVAFTQVNKDSGADVYVMDAGGTPRPFVQTTFAEGTPRFSPDGRWIAYTANESGRNQIYVQAYPGPGAKMQVSTDGGTDPVWKRSGGELYYRDGDKMMVVQVNTAGVFEAAKPTMLWAGRFAHGLGSSCGPPGTTSSNYDVTADGRRFLMIRHHEEAPKQINVVVNWAEELKRAVQ